MKNAEAIPVASAAENLPDDPANGELNEALRFIEKSPDLAAGYIKLSTEYIKRARRSGDFSLNTKAETAANRALEIDPENISAKKLKASLELTFHRFDKALQYGTALQKEYPSDAFFYGVLTDANVELGNYKEAVDAAQKMVDTRPNSASYARVAHLRSLHGDSAGAIEMYKLAAQTADPADMEAQSWCHVQLSKEYFKSGNLAEAEKSVGHALELLPNYYLATTQKGIVLAAKGDLENAAKTLEASQEQVPQVEGVITLGDLYTKMGNADKAAKQYALAETIEQNFGNTDLRRLAMLWADRNIRLDEALKISSGEQALRKDIYTADVFAWCLFKNGKLAEAKVAIAEATRLKTNDARTYYHAGMIENGLGNKAEARRYFKLALKTNPHFDLLQVDEAKRTLTELG